MQLFKKLTPVEEVSFRKWARENYKPLSAIQGTWHPVTQAECVKMNEEAGNALDLPWWRQNPEDLK